MMAVAVGFEELKISCIVGVEPEEREKEQEILLDLKVTADFGKSIEKDQITGTPDYDLVASFCKGLIQKRKFFLIETMAHAVAKELLASFPISKVFIRVKKPGALPEAKHSFVELSMVRGEN